MATPIQLKCPDCPQCGHPPGFLLSPVQAFCGNDDCAAFSWNPSQTPAHQRANQHTIDLRGPEPTDLG